ncbi:hypothetical protein A5653_01910 [Mycobacterium colombiense]|uniref:SRPBCC family protein n=1 Tax=Mycobacterium colombiense TaxID=339268 RepID=UPI0007EFC292|nr:SRPBCC family protein [Mycobacterium colombiense]OBK68936.1 hypothetical protein A5653_01910 [Mycobacterium colombiense]
MTALLSRELDYLDDAPVRVCRSAVVAVDKDLLFAVIAEDPAQWGCWCAGFTTASRWTTAAPPGVGSRRTMHAFGTDFHETVLAFDAGARFVFRVDECSVPILKAFVEEWRFDAVPNSAQPRTILTWAMAADSPLPVAVMRPFLRIQQAVLMKLAARRLRRRYGR